MRQTFANYSELKPGHEIHNKKEKTLECLQSKMFCHFQKYFVSSYRKGSYGFCPLENSIERFGQLRFSHGTVYGLSCGATWRYPGFLVWMDEWVYHGSWKTFSRPASRLDTVYGLFHVWNQVINRLKNKSLTMRMNYIELLLSDLHYVQRKWIIVMCCQQTKVCKEMPP